MKAFWRRHGPTLLTAAVAVGCFMVVFALYGLPLEAVAYAAGLSLIPVAVWGGVRWYRTRTNCRTLRVLEKSEAFQPRDLPPADTQVEEAYGELVERLWMDNQRLATESDRRVSDMTDYYTLWAHQIKTPIAAMRLLLQADEEDSASSDELSGELFKIEQYVDMVLGYLRVDSDRTDFVLGRCDLDAVVRGAVRKYAGSFIRRRVRLCYEPLNASVLTDEKWLLFVVEQLLSNALKYTPSGGAVTIRLAGASTLVIADTGIGIAPEDLPRVFDRGYTGYNGRTDKKSTGIGLYLCRRVTDMLGHTLRLESEVGRGTAAYIGMDSVPVTGE